MWKFSRKKGQTNGTHFLCSYVAMPVFCVHTPHTIQVWGIASFVLFGFFHNHLSNIRKLTPHFLFFIITRHRGVVWF